MDHQFTDRARRVMQLANQEAQRFNHEYIGTENVLVGLIKEGSGIAANVLRHFGVKLGEVRAEVDKLVQPGPDMITMGKLPETPRVKQIINYAIDEAQQLDHVYVGTEHLLLGLLREREGIAFEVLTKLGVDADQVRQETLTLIGRPSAGADERQTEDYANNLVALGVIYAALSVGTGVGVEIELPDMLGNSLTVRFPFSASAYRVTVERIPGTGHDE